MNEDIIIGLGVIALAAISLILGLWMRRRARSRDPLDREAAEEIQRARGERDDARNRDAFPL